MRKIMRQMINKAAIAERYAISVGSVKNLMNRRILPFIKIGRIVRFDVENCDKAMSAFESKSIALANEKAEDNNGKN